MVVAEADLTGIATLALALVTAALAAFTYWSVRTSKDILAAQERPLLLDQPPDYSRPENVTVAGPGPTAAYGTMPVHVGEVIVGAGAFEDGHASVCSMSVRNVGRGVAEITRARLMSLDTLPEGGGPQYVDAQPRSHLVPVGEAVRITAAMIPEAPGWFWRNAEGRTKLWFEVTYTDLDHTRSETRWFELEPAPGDVNSWRVGPVLRGAPQQFRNPPAPT